MIEIWADVKGFENIYQVSNLGRVRSLSRILEHTYKETTRNAVYKSKILSLCATSTGYLKVDLYINGLRVVRKAHRLVAEAFIDNPLNKHTVNHKDGNKINNTLDNLEWATQREQIVHAYKNGLIKPNVSGFKGILNYWKGKTGAQHFHSKRIYMLDMEGQYLKEFPCAAEVERELGFFAVNISKCAKGLSKTAYKHKWTYEKKL